MPREADENIALDFGKYRGRKICDVPPSYLSWVLDNVDGLDAYLRGVIEQSLRRRRRGRSSSSSSAAPPPPPRQESTANVVSRDHLKDTVRSWYRTLAADYHHDRGHDQAVMCALNVARDRLIVALSLE